MKVTFPNNNNTVIIRIPESWSFDYFKTIISDSLAGEDNTSHTDNDSIMKMKETLLVLFRGRKIYLKTEGLLRSSPTNIGPDMIFSFKTCSCNVRDKNLVIVDNRTIQRDLNDENLTSVIFLHKNNYIKIDFTTPNSHSPRMEMVIINISTLKEVSSLLSDVNIVLNDDAIFVDEPIFRRNSRSLNDETTFTQPCSLISRNLDGSYSLNNPPPREYRLSSKSPHVFSGLDQKKMFSPLPECPNGENGQLSMILSRLDAMSLEICQLKDNNRYLTTHVSNIIDYLRSDDTH